MAGRRFRVESRERGAVLVETAILIPDHAHHHVRADRVLVGLPVVVGRRPHRRAPRPAPRRPKRCSRRTPPMPRRRRRRRSRPSAPTSPSRCGSTRPTPLATRSRAVSASCTTNCIKYAWVQATEVVRHRQPDRRRLGLHRRSNACDATQLGLRRRVRQAEPQVHDETVRRQHPPRPTTRCSGWSPRPTQLCA